MASVNKVIIEFELLTQLYVAEKKSIPQVSKELHVPRSTVRARLLELGLLRARADAIRLAAGQGRIGAHMRGVKRNFTPEWRANIAAARRKHADANASGVSLKPSGYLAHTRGLQKGRAVHVALMEEAINRRLSPQEVVHHKDHNRANNELSNLELMTRSAHASLHGKENHMNRKRRTNGQFE